MQGVFFVQFFSRRFQKPQKSTLARQNLNILNVFYRFLLCSKGCLPETKSLNSK
ncbi:hypothetical protein CLOM621_05764 [Clostridium sp. M62/1]|nr:hypothetical protein CLOM621_05764 [Clostridium sp. M62/1]CBK77139.1 hypothetical protein CLS_15480 [[Clostridium] cf. saccharolyticum K10]